MLVRLYDLPEYSSLMKKLEREGVVIRRPLAAEKSIVLEQGYAYAIIGGVGPAEFYAKAVGAVLIEGSSPGIYQGIMSEVPVE